MKDARELFEKYKAGQCSEEEILLLRKWFHEFHNDDDSALSELDLTIAKDNFKKVADEYVQVRKLYRIPYKLVVAASIILVIGMFAYLHLRRSTTDSVQMDSYVQGDDVAPGTDNAILTLGDGKKISLSDAGHGTLVDGSGLMILKDAQGRVTYQVTGSHTEVEYNMIETPKGGQYQIQLADGTKVWLNAASTLKFPSSFSGLSERKVEMTGEAYFEVVKDVHRPFVVHSDQQDIEVLGTSFNISNYGEDHFVKTSLLSGSIKVIPINNDHRLDDESVVIEPGQQSLLTEKTITVRKVDTAEVVDWKNGDFIFNQEPLEAIMNKIARWYDIDVTYDNELDSRQTFSGQVSREKKLSAILYALESTNLIQFKIEDNHVFVKKKQGN